jgi:hypothetical protein
LVRILKFFDADTDPGSGILVDPGSEIRNGKIRIRDKYPGSATLIARKWPIFMPVKMSNVKIIA